MQDFVVITGFSGAGKSQAMACFEDAGYFCVDNLPPEMIRQLAELFEHEGSKVEKAAVVSDVRTGGFFEGLVEVLDDFVERGIPHRLLYLDASDDTLRQPLQGDARAASTRQRRRPAGRRGGRAGGGRRCHRDHRRAQDPRAAARARRRLHRHQRPERRAPAQGRCRQDAPARQRRQAGRDLPDLRLQARRPARRRPPVRRPLPAQPALRVRPAPAHRARRARARDTWRAPTASATSTTT